MSGAWWDNDLSLLPVIFISVGGIFRMTAELLYVPCSGIVLSVGVLLNCTPFRVLFTLQWCRLLD